MPVKDFMNTLYPISITEPNWEYVSKAFAECFKSNIDSGIINNRMKKDIGTYIGVLGLNNDPLTDLRLSAKSTLGHVSVGFAFRVDFEIMRFIASTSIHNTIQTIEDQYFIISTGSLDQWLNACFEASQVHQDFELRLLFNKIIIYFDNIRLKQIVNNFEKVPLKDKTFVLKRT